MLHQNGQDTAHYVDSLGYKQVPEFLQEQQKELVPDNYLTGEKVTTPRGSFSLPSMSREQMEAADNEKYGWLSPAGSFYPVPFGEHQQWAFEKIRKAKDLYDAFKSEYGYGWDEAGDFLIQRRWALLDNPRLGPAILQYNLETGLTKHQREFIFQYYSERGRRDEANRLYQGGEFL